MNYNNETDWDSFHKQLELSIELKVPLKTPYQLGNYIGALVKAIQQAAWFIIFVKRTTIKDEVIY